MSEFNEFLQDSGLTAVLDAADIWLCPWGHTCEWVVNVDSYYDRDTRFVWRCSDDAHPPLEYPLVGEHLLAMFHPVREGAYDTFFYIQNTETGEWFLQQPLGDGDPIVRKGVANRWLEKLNSV